MSAERLFFALWPEAALRNALLAERAALAATPGRLSHPLDLHLTLVFIGAVDRDVRSCIEAAADDVFLAPFALRIHQLCCWPKQRLWLAQPDVMPNALANLVSQLQQNLLACGLPPEARRYRPHITLARKAPTVTPRQLALDWTVRDFVLAAGAHGRTPSYRILRSWPLTAC